MVGEQEVLVIDAADAGIFHMDAVGAELMERLRFVPYDLVSDGLHGLVNFVSAVVGAGANGAGEHLLLAIDHGRNAHHIVGARLQT